MSEDVYEKLRAHLDTFPTSFPDTEEGAAIGLLKKFFSEEEAEMAVQLPLMMGGVPKNSQTIAQEMKKDVEKVEDILDTMAKKGLIYVVNEGKAKGYSLLPFVPGIMEFNVEKFDVEVAELYERFYKGYIVEKMKSKVPLTKVVPINRSISVETSVHPYEDVVNALEHSTSICLMDCMCRTQKKLIGEDCGRPIETCLYLNQYADHLLSIGKGKRLTKEEAVEVITKAEDAGLIHISNNAQGLQGLCSCCGCCCGALRGITKMKNPNAVAKSDFRLVIDPDLCNGCGECVERCLTEALSIGNEHVAVDRERCIGCGSCSYICPTEALSLRRKPLDEIKPTPRSFVDLLSEMGWR